VTSRRSRLRRIRTVILGTVLLLFQYKVVHLFFSPVLVVAAAWQGIANGSLLVYLALFLSALVFGRAWCGWLCPGTAINEACGVVVARRRRRGPGDRIKFAVCALLLSAVAAGAWYSGGLHRIDLLFGVKEAGPSWRPVVLAAGPFVIIVGAAAAFGRFANCGVLCWEAPILIAGAWLGKRAPWPSLRLVARTERCSSCEECSRSCPMSLDVATAVQGGDLSHTECILCGTCVDHCPTGAVRFGFRRTKEPGRPD
jgi:ferredoxin-type protein NapH